MPRLYQKTWNGIDLADIARDPACLTSGIPNARFYAEYYRRLKEGGYDIPAYWLESRRGVSKRLGEWLAEFARVRRRDHEQLRVLSVSAGLGLVEVPLLRQGFNITLHEVTGESFEYAQRLAKSEGVGALRELICPVSRIPSKSFDVVFVGNCEYCCFDATAYLDFLADIRRIAADDSHVIAWDPAPTWKFFLQDILERAHPNARMHPNAERGVFWGILRTPRERISCFQGQGLAVETVELFTTDWTTRLASGPALPRLNISLWKSVNAVIRARPVENR